MWQVLVSWKGTVEHKSLQSKINLKQWNIQATLIQKQHKYSFYWNFLVKDQAGILFVKEGISGDHKSYRSILITTLANKLVFGSKNDTKRVVCISLRQEHKRVGFLSVKTIWWAIGEVK